MTLRPPRSCKSADFSPERHRSSTAHTSRLFCTLVPAGFRVALLWGPASCVLCPAALPSNFQVGRDERHNLSCSLTGEVIFLQPALEAESQ